MAVAAAFPSPLIGFAELGAVLQMSPKTLRTVHSAGMLPVRSSIRGGSSVFHSGDVALLGALLSVNARAV